MLAGYLGNYSRYEIERKFLLDELPDTLPKHFIDIQDTYLPNSSLRLRIEKSSTGEIVGRKLTKKDKAPDKGRETSVITSLYLSEKDLIAIGELKGNSIEKRRYIDERPEQRIVFDVFKGDLEGLVMAEIEFKDYQALSNFELEGLGWKEVTADPNYACGNLAQSLPSNSSARD